MIRVRWDSSSLQFTLQCDQVIEKNKRNSLLNERIQHLSSSRHLSCIRHDENEIHLHEIHPSLCLGFHLVSSLVHAQRLKIRH